jgi:tRNA threonylcarbamoyladenosine biosynthesis protein TsaE
MSPGTIVIRAVTAEAMKAIGRRLGRQLRIGDVVGLVGDLGSGKTTLAQGIAEGLEVPSDRHVTSPTFSLVNEHPARIPFVHADLYRVNRDVELAELGLDEIFDRATAVVEWIDLFPSVAPADHLVITISIAPDDSRALSIRATGPRGKRLSSVLAEHDQA